MFSNKTLIIIISILILLVGGFLIYYYFQGEPKSAITPDDTTSGSQSTERIKLISQESVLGPVIDNQKVKYYSANNGYIFESDFDGAQLARISSNALPGLLDALWSPSKNKVITLFEKDNLLKKYLYDYQTQKSILLDQNIRDLTWSPTKDRIAYQYYNSQTEDNNISIANPDGSQWTNLIQTRMKNLIIKWPVEEKLSLMTRPSGLAQSVLYTLDLIDNDFKKVIDQTYGLTVLWSPLGDKILFSETDYQGKNLKLKIADLTKQTIAQLNFTTLPEKCVWSQDNRTLFCAIPQNIPNSAVLPDDYYKGSVSFSDEFWRISLDTERAVQISESQNEKTSVYDAIQLLLSPQEDYLLFINQKDGWLYSLKL